jgi:thiamine-monophosphate kinase
VRPRQPVRGVEYGSAVREYLPKIIAGAYGNISAIAFLGHSAASIIHPPRPIPPLRIVEDELIERIRRRIPSSEGGALRLGIGHDAALIHPQGRDWVVTCDQFVEGVHFLADKHPPESVGYKALVRAASDVVAMAAQPRLFLLSLALPAKRTGTWLNTMLAGMARASKLLGLRLAGGDTTRSPGERGGVALNLMVLGETQGGRTIGRAGARPGEGIYVTGILGRAQLGLELILRGSVHQRKYRKLVGPHYYPALPLDFALWLGRHHLASAMMDISDGLSTDLTRLCEASGVGARIDADRLPVLDVPGPLRDLPKLDPLTLALHGGEDYGLLFTVAKRAASRIPRIFGRTRITRIGETVRGSEVTIVARTGKVSSLTPGGWDPFGKR